MTNPQTDPEVELEEGEIEDDGCEVETESALGCLAVKITNNCV